MLSILQAQLQTNLDVSLIVELKKNISELRYMLDRHKNLFELNGVEIIVCTALRINDNELINIFEEFPFVNIKILDYSNDATGLGLANISGSAELSSKKYLLFANEITLLPCPEEILVLRSFAEVYLKSYFISLPEPVNSPEQTQQPLKIGVAGLLVRKEDWVSISGKFTNNPFTSFAAEYLAPLFDAAGLKRIVIERNKKRQDNNSSRPAPQILNAKTTFHTGASLQATGILFPNKGVKSRDVNKPELRYSYEEKKWAELTSGKYLSTFQKHWVKPHAFTRKYNIITLVPAYNEVSLINESLENHARYSDGIILLDDESTDGTFEAAHNEKLILKVKKRRGPVFNDLENRNMLLNLVSFFPAAWVLFMDADERFDERFAIDTESLQGDIISIPMVNLWQDPFHYRSDISYGDNMPEGILLRKRMFKVRGRMQIILKNRTLHFPTIPYFDGRNSLAPVLVRHFGTITESLRESKFNFYRKEGIDWAMFKGHYNFLLDDRVQITPLENITHKVLEECVQKF